MISCSAESRLGGDEDRGGHGGPCKKHPTSLVTEIDDHDGFCRTWKLLMIRADGGTTSTCISTDEGSRETLKNAALEEEGYVRSECDRARGEFPYLIKVLVCMFYGHGTTFSAP